MMKKLITLAALLVCGAAFAQNTASDFKARYERQVRNVGYGGVGVETIIDRWEALAPEDPEMLVARFNYYLAKCQVSEVLPKNQSRFLGQKPALTLKDAEGNDVNYFEETFYEDSLYAKAMTAIDKAVELYPDDLRYRYHTVTALMAYEKESPDMAADELFNIIEMDREGQKWKLDGEAVDEDVFVQGISEYCVYLFQTGSEISYEYFYKISLRMNKYYPKEPIFLDNIGSYWMVAKKNNKQAAKFYNKALKLDPEDYAATRNLKLIQSLQSQKGQSSK